MGILGNFLGGKKRVSKETFPEPSHDISNDTFAQDPLMSDGNYEDTGMAYSGSPNYGSADGSGLPPPSFGQGQQNSYPQATKEFEDNLNHPDVQIREIPQNYGSQQYPQQSQSNSQNFNNDALMDIKIEKSLEVISTKLDALRVVVENLDHRLKNIERIAMNEDNDSSRRPRW